MKLNLDLLDFIPHKIFSGKKNILRKLHKDYDEKFIGLYYTTKGYNNSIREHNIAIPRFISKSERTFEVLGLLQAEMGKTQNGTLSFANNQPKIVNNVLNWFKKELDLKEDTWRWSIKLNLNEPIDKNYKKEIESKVIKYWVEKTKISFNQAYPKRVTYIKNTNNKKLKFFDKGSVVLEYRNNLFSQIIKTFVRKITYEEILKSELNIIKSYMKGIFAGESCIEDRKKSGHYRIHLTANKLEERKLYQKCLEKLNIKAREYDNYKDVIISEKENHLKLLKLRLMTLNPKKYSKFLNMISRYKEFPELKEYRKQFKNEIWNKIPKEKVNKIMELYKLGTTRTTEIAKILEISKIKVNRVLKENNLGKRRVKDYPESLKKKIVKYAKKNPKISQREITEKFNISEQAVRRALQKYGFKKTAKDRIKTSIEKINKILKLYRENPKIKFKEVIEKVKISDTALVNIRRIYGIHRLGHYYVVGNNPKGKNQYSKPFKQEK